MNVPSPLIERLPLAGKLGVIVAAYIGDGPLLPELPRYIALVPKLITGNTVDLDADDWFVIVDALAAWPEDAADLARVRAVAGDGYRRVKAGEHPRRTPCLDELFATKWRGYAMKNSTDQIDIIGD
ncbi:MAG TPA: hypothetical protein VM452_01150 [Caulifigura sp.]|jgi:hypothetical protein|nr:hypothetical protein [Caulifigura sp.]